MSRFLGLAAVIVGLVGYVPYLWGMYQGKVRPHAFTWLLWGVLTAIAYAAQLADHAAAGSWATGATAVICLGIAGAAWRQSRLSTVAPVDWYFFIAALAAIPLWLLTATPLYSVLLITFIDAVAYIPTFRKSWLHPEEEALATYVTNTVKFLLSIAALPEQTIVSSLYPWSIVATNALFIAMALWRRRRV